MLCREESGRFFPPRKSSSFPRRPGLLPGDRDCSQDDRVTASGPHGTRQAQRGRCLEGRGLASGPISGGLGNAYHVHWLVHRHGAGNEFDAHWTDVDVDRVTNTLPEITLQGGFTRVQFLADQEAPPEATPRQSRGRSPGRRTRPSCSQTPFGNTGIEKVAWASCP